MARVWNTPIFILATAYFVVDGMLSHVTQPIAAWLAEKKLFVRVRRLIISLGPYSSLALFAVPVIILEPAKPLAGYLIGTGHFFAGAVTFITAEVLKLHSSSGCLCLTETSCCPFRHSPGDINIGVA